MVNFGTHPQRWEDVQICTYAMCKNELKFVDNWVRNVWNNGNGSNYITILDTGSTDGTWERLQQIRDSKIIPEGHFIIGQKETSPWRFDIARNNSMELIPSSDLIDACFCLDLDELVEPDFWVDYKKAVFEHPNFRTIQYQYAWKVNDDGSPNWYFWYDKTHGPIGWKWEYPVHETLTCANPELYDGTTYYLDNKKIYVKHYPDPAKSRGSYLNLLEIRAQENPADITSNYYLAREYSYRSRWEDTFKYVEITINLMNASNYLAKCPEEYAVLHALAGRALFHCGRRDKALPYLEHAIDTVPSCRPPYILAAQIYAYSGNYEEAYRLLDKMDKEAPTSLNTSWRIPGWYNSNWKRAQIVADAKSWEGKYSEAWEIIQKAHDEIMDDEKYAAEEALFYVDYEFLKNQVKGLLDAKSESFNTYNYPKPASQESKQCSWVTLLYDNSYIGAVIGLVLSLKKYHTKYPICCIITPSISPENRHALVRLGITIVDAPEYISDTHKQYIENHPAVQKIKQSKVQWADSVLKLLAYDLIQFDKIVYIDSDVWIRDNMDEIFEYPADSACVDLCGKGTTLCAGMIVIEPSNEVYDTLKNINDSIMKNATDSDLISDQSTLLQYYSNWGNDTNQIIPSEYNWWVTCADEVSDINKIKSWHYTGPKPWNTPLKNLEIYKEEYPKYYEELINYSQYLDNCYDKISKAGITCTDWKKILGTDDSNVYFSIVIPYHYEGFEATFPLLSSINNQVGIDFSKIEILICSNESKSNLFDVSIYKNIANRIKFLYKDYSISGPGQSRQLGLDNAKGKYITFYDCDDSLFSPISLYEAFTEIKQAEDNGIDFNVINFNYIDEIYGDIKYQTYHSPEFVPYVQWCAIYNRKYLIDNHFGFNMDIAISEDVYFTLNLLCADTKFIHSDKFIYVHEMIRDSTGNTWLYTNNRIKDTFLFASQLMDKYHTTFNDYPQQIIEYTCMEAFASIYEHTDHFNKFSVDDKRSALQTLSDFMRKYDETGDFIKISDLSDQMKQEILTLYFNKEI